MRHCRATWQILRVLFFALSVTHLAFAGKLDRAGNKARGSSSNHSSSSSSSSDSDGDSGSASDALALANPETIVAVGYAIYGAALVATSPFWAPYQVLEGDNPLGTTKQLRFANYPYADGAAGHLLFPAPIVYNWEGRAITAGKDRLMPRLLQRTSLDLGLESGVGLSDGITRLGVRARLRLPRRVDFDFDWSFLRERDNGGLDTAMMGQEHFAIRFAQASRIVFRAGLGMQHFCDAISCEHGIDVTYGFEAFPGRPWVLSAQGSIGTLGEAFAPGVKARLGFLVGPVEMNVGYHGRWVGGVPLGGPFIGISYWF